MEQKYLSKTLQGSPNISTYKQIVNKIPCKEQEATIILKLSKPNVSKLIQKQNFFSDMGCFHIRFLQVMLQCTPCKRRHGKVKTSNIM
jgi:hypothetical protein